MADIKESLRRAFTAEEMKLLRRAYDVIGDIAILEVPDELKKKQRKIAWHLLETKPNIRTVLRKAGGHAGELRTQKMAYIAGKRTKETIAVENKIRIKLNVQEVYYSPRMSTERARIYSQVKEERVLVMFSGAGPYALEIAKHSPATEVIGVELNKSGHAYAVENAKLNKLDNVHFIQGDVRKVVPKLKRKFDRIVMPLPKGAEVFLDVAFNKIHKGGRIHFYDFQREEDIPDKSIEKVKFAAKEAHKRVNITDVVRCGQLAVRQYRVCVDVKVTS